MVGGELAADAPGGGLLCFMVRLCVAVGASTSWSVSFRFVAVALAPITLPPAIFPRWESSPAFLKTELDFSSQKGGQRLKLKADISWKGRGGGLRLHLG